MTPEARKRLKTVVAMHREEGKTFRQIGTVLGVSGQRARELFLEGERLEEKEHMGEEDFWRLSTRSAYALFCARIETKQAVIEALKAGRLRPGKIRNLGKKSIAEIAAWAGFKGEVCSKCGRPL